MWVRLNTWSNKKISKAGKEILIEVAAQAIPTYCMNVFLLPPTLLDELYRMINRLWWRNDSWNAKGTMWSKWEDLCGDKSDGGMTFKNLRIFRIAFLVKIGWRLIDEPNALVSRILKVKYYARTDFLSASLG